MDYYLSIWSVLSIYLIFLTGLIVALVLGYYLRITKARVFLFYIWHTLFSIIYYYYVSLHGGDALEYYELAKIDLIPFSFGSNFVRYLISAIINCLNLSFIGISLIFNIFGTIGLLAFDSSLSFATKNSSRLIKYFAFFIVMLPSVSFWSSGIGKDSISFMATCCGLWASLNLRKRTLVMGFMVSIMMLVRPHVSAVMLISYLLAYFINNNITILKKLLICTILVIVAIFLVPFILKYTGFIENLDLNNIRDYIEMRQSYNLEGASSVDIASMNLPTQMYTYMFKPLFSNINSIYDFIAAFDNTILLFLFVAYIINIFTRNRIILNNTNIEASLFMWVYSFSLWIIFSMTTANTGIALRQKWMFLPMFIFLIISKISNSRIVYNTSKVII